jgi:hypothetical protein
MLSVLELQIALMEDKVAFLASVFFRRDIPSPHLGNMPQENSYKSIISPTFRTEVFLDYGYQFAHILRRRIVLHGACFCE